MRPEQAVFGLGNQPDGSHVAVIGIHEKAWEHMRDGQTHTFDLRSLGYPVQIILFGAKDQSTAIRLMTDHPGPVEFKPDDFGMK